MNSSVVDIIKKLHDLKSETESPLVDEILVQMTYLLSSEQPGSKKRKTLSPPPFPNPYPRSPCSPGYSPS